LAQVDSLKNPSWKRRQHRFYEKVTKPLVLELHDALYLSQLAYVNKIEDFRDGLAKFQNNVWELGYGTTESLPHMPAHFLLIHKHLGPLRNQKMDSFLPWEAKKESEIEVTLVVRGTKHLSDALADALLEPVEYRGGYAHGGILASGKALAETYLPKLKELLKHSGRDTVRLYLVGHSLGAAAASIAAMEFNDHDFIKVEAVGFGCPSLLSHELSESAKDYITTVVADADIIPRMSGSSMVNMLLDLLEYDWTDSALEDIEYSLERSREVASFGHLLPPKETVLKWSEEFFNNRIRPKFGKEKRDRLPSVLIPPGNCIHFFRDGVGFSGAYTPCNFFSSIDLARTLVDDHLIMPGYHRALVSIVRDWEQNYNVSILFSICLFVSIHSCSHLCSLTLFMTLHPFLFNLGSTPTILLQQNQPLGCNQGGSKASLLP
jgi:pimeloyl-ACP methyl ester carboxylesterase